LIISSKTRAFPVTYISKNKKAYISLWKLVPCIKLQQAIYLVVNKINLVTARDQGLQHPHPLTDSLPPDLKKNAPNKMR
jgi:hypothetical protein